MITKFSSIKGYAVFKDFNWDASVVVAGNIIEFGKLNIIYGRNYSGKTTLSRIMQSFELNTLHEKYPEAKFTLKSSEPGITMSHANLGHPYQIRVFNKDFIKENLGWLIDGEKGIKPFTTVTLGSDNNAILTKISDIDKELGTEETGGARYNYKQKRDDYGRKMSAYSDYEKETENLLRGKAVKIKNEAALYNKVTYNINSIQSDIAALTSSPRSILSDDETDILKASLREMAKDAISQVRPISLNYNSLLSETNNIITKIIRPSEAIQELVENALLQEWARRGIELHKNKESKCGFCGSSLTEEVWKRLGAHFNQESEELDAIISTLLRRIEDERQLVSAHMTLSKDAIYSEFHSSFEVIEKAWELRKSKCIEVFR